MRAGNKILITLISICILLPGCIEPYNLFLDETQHSIVIQGNITDQTGYQHIFISRSASLNDTIETPVEGCYVEMSDGNGNSIVFSELAPGKYGHMFEPDEITVGNSYRLIISTSEGSDYQSALEEMLPCPPITNVYYRQEIKETSDPELPEYGLQFYLDLEAAEDDPRHFRWMLEETWEYHVPYHINYYYDGEIHAIDENEADALKRCWKTERIHQVHCMTTDQLDKNEILQYPLVFTNSQSNRLLLKYSLLVRQQSLSESAYDYWEQLRLQSQESGGLYENQPVRIIGNISNINDPSERVLGYFSVSAVEERRIVISEDFDFPFWFMRCELGPVTDYYLSRQNPQKYPIYIMCIDNCGSEGDEEGAEILRTAPKECFDCRLGGGTTEKPSFWDEY